jgi:CTP:molybdopterin cytidylyltransferase MocA
MNCGALILAAGASTRLGYPKQLVCWGNETLLDRSIRIAREAGCVPVVVVLGAFEDLIRSRCNLQGVLTLSNPEWAEGMGTSLSMGVRACDDVPGILVMTCDMPAVTADHLIALKSSGTVTASVYANRKGVPAYFPNDLFSRLIAITGDNGARNILQSAVGIELKGGELDIDTTEDVRQLRKWSFPVTDGRSQC